LEEAENSHPSVVKRARPLGAVRKHWVIGSHRPHLLIAIITSANWTRREQTRCCVLLLFATTVFLGVFAPKLHIRVFGDASASKTNRGEHTEIASVSFLVAASAASKYEQDHDDSNEEEGGTNSNQNDCCSCIQNALVVVQLIVRAPNLRSDIATAVRGGIRHGGREQLAKRAMPAKFLTPQTLVGI